MPTWQQDLLQQAKRNKRDEFYTQLPDIAEELKHYPDVFQEKTVYLNCDDPRESNFYKYFVDNFDLLGVKKLIATSYWPNGRLDEDGSCRARVVEYFRPQPEAPPTTIVTPLEGNGDFRSEESINFLEQCDIVVTNPPFSLFREFITQLVSFEKQFIVLGNMTASTSKDIFPLFMNNRVWYGKSIHSGDREFAVPADYPLEAVGTRIDADGTRYIRVKGVRWFTNVEYAGRHTDLSLTEAYDPDKYPKYVNFDAIDVAKTAMIPRDYAGLMGVPVSFLDKYNPDQFEIVGSSRTLSEPMDRFVSKGSYSPGGPRFYLPKGDGTYRRLFERIVIRNKLLQSDKGGN